MKGVSDFNCEKSCSGVGSAIFGANHARGKTCFFTAHRLFTTAYLSQMCPTLSRRTIREEIPLSRSVSGDGICSTHLSRRTPRYRSLPSCTTKQTLSYGNSNKGIQEYTGRCQRTTRLEDLRRLRPGTDQNCAASICKRRSWLDLDNTVYALDASTIDLCLSVFPWALFRATKSAVKLHTLLDLRGNIPTFIHISDGKLHDVNVLDILITEPGAFYIMDRGYVDFERLFTLNQAGSFFVIRAKRNTQYKRRYSHAIDTSNGLRCDQSIVLTGLNTKDDYPQLLRRVKYHDSKTGKTFNFLTNNFVIPAQTIADLYRYRWQVELFFKWIKQHLRIKSFFGTSENAVKSQIWIAISVYVLVAIIKKRLDIETDLYTILQILSLALFELIPLDQLLMKPDYQEGSCAMDNQLNLFDYLTGQ